MVVSSHSLYNKWFVHRPERRIRRAEMGDATFAVLQDDYCCASIIDHSWRRILHTNV